MGSVQTDDFCGARQRLGKSWVRMAASGSSVLREPEHKRMLNPKFKMILVPLALRPSKGALPRVAGMLNPDGDVPVNRRRERRASVDHRMLAEQDDLARRRRARVVDR